MVWDENRVLGTEKNSKCVGTARVSAAAHIGNGVEGNSTLGSVAGKLAALFGKETCVTVHNIASGNATQRQLAAW